MVNVRTAVPQTATRRTLHHVAAPSESAANTGIEASATQKMINPTKTPHFVTLVTNWQILRPFNAEVAVDNITR